MDGWLNMQHKICFPVNQKNKRIGSMNQVIQSNHMNAISNRAHLSFIYKVVHQSDVPCYVV